MRRALIVKPLDLLNCALPRRVLFHIPNGGGPEGLAGKHWLMVIERDLEAIPGSVSLQVGIGMSCPFPEPIVMPLDRVGRIKVLSLGPNPPSPPWLR